MPHRVRFQGAGHDVGSRHGLRSGRDQPDAWTRAVGSLTDSVQQVQHGFRAKCESGRQWIASPRRCVVVSRLQRCTTTEGFSIDDISRT